MASPLVRGLFDVVFRPWMARRIANVRVAGVPAGLSRPDRPLLLCCNHVSWWDGFLARDLARLVRPGAPFHALALEEELARRPLLRKLGGVGIRPGSVGSVRRAARRLEQIAARDPSAVVAIFPQGRIWPADRRPLGFFPGVRLFRRLVQPCWTLPVALRLEPLADARPTAFLSVGRPVPPAAEDDVVAEIEARVTEELDALARFLAVHGERASEAWPPARTALPRAPGPFRPGARADRPALAPSLN